MENDYDERKIIEQVRKTEKSREGKLADHGECRCEDDMYYLGVLCN